MTKVFLIHGWDGHPHNNWFPWLIAELKAKYIEVEAPYLPNPAAPKVKGWLSYLKDYVGKADEETFFVAHSLGCNAVLRLLETLNPKVKIGGCIFVGGFSGDIGIPEVSEFVSLPLDLKKAKSHAKKIINIFSDNDEVVTLAESLKFARDLGAKKIMIKGAGHFGSEDGYKSLPIVLEALLPMLKI
ncbi:MAG: alpha/beta hydrolase [Candidatus Paceibacterota bacterium]|jgi:hypothetical protein